MRLGLQLNRWNWDPDVRTIAPKLREVVKLTEDVGYASISTMDHFFQIPGNGAYDDPMLEAYATLGFIAANTSRVQVGCVVTAATYRHPGVLVKQATTLDVLSGGRAFLGLGAGFYEREHLGLGIPFPSTGERMGRLYETLQIAHHMWGGEGGSFKGRYYQLEDALNIPAPIQQPHPPILIGGGGEQKTLRLVAKFADACNLFGQMPPAELQHKLDVLRGHCEREGRDYNQIEKTVQFQLDVTAGPSAVGPIVDRLGQLASMGFTRAIGGVKDLETLKPLETIGTHLIPQIEKL
jgi:F420-dependent oxidoreductase-like protein